MSVRPMIYDDLACVSEIHSLAFPRQHDSHRWLKCTLRAYPRFLCFVKTDRSNIVGFIIWAQKSGFRQDVVLELEQIAVHPDFMGNGFGEDLIESSLVNLRNLFTELGVKIKQIVVTTREDNRAQDLYRRVLGAEVEAIISDLYSSNEIFMIARDASKNITRR